MRHREQSSTTPFIKNDCLHLPDGQQIEIGCPEWFTWLAGQLSFYYADSSGTLHARPEQRAGRWYWYGYKKKSGVLNKGYLGKADAVTTRKLALVCGQLNRA